MTRYRAEDLTAVTHHDELVPRAGCVVHTRRGPPGARHRLVRPRHLRLLSRRAGRPSLELDPARALIAFRSAASLPTFTPPFRALITEHTCALRMTSNEQCEAAQAGAGRRSFLRATALLGAAATAGVALPTSPPRRPRPRCREPVGVPTPTAGASRSPSCPTPSTSSTGRASTRRPIEASLRYLLEHGQGREHRLPVPPRRPHPERRGSPSSPRSARRSSCWTGGVSATASSRATTT